MERLKLEMLFAQTMKGEMYAVVTLSGMWERSCG
jgi:hypothetical protein